MIKTFQVSETWKVCEETIQTAREILKIDSKSARWVANDALRELTKKRMKE